MRVVISLASAPYPGDLRALVAGDTIELRPSARDREDWSGILCALPNAVARGASVVWKREGG